ncbi:MAG TPA: branched-chain amino acid ABC transporter permease [Syntrophorhabdales bacterium]|nr:branched-chain amino acid ABC transporter permease [Syntrophorhabdales bacterium]
MSFFTFSGGALNGLLLGGLYAITALEFSMIFGVMGLMNVVHGELLILGAYLCFFISRALGIDPFLATLVVAIILFAVGYLLQRSIFNPVMDRGVEPALLTAFGLSIIAQSLFLFYWTTNSRSINTSYSQTGLQVLGIHLPVMYLISFGLSLVLIAGVHAFMTRSFLGKAIRAATQDPVTAQVMGINVKRVYAFTYGLAAATAALGGALIGMTFSFVPSSGLSWLLKGFVIVVLGGMGSIVGTFAGALLLGVVEGVGGAVMGTGYRDLIGLVIVLLVLVAKPTGLFGRAR